jgi:hypothetical protein
MRNMTKSAKHLALVAAVLGLASVAAVAQGPGWQGPYGPGLGGHGWQGRINQVGDPALEAAIADTYQAIRRAQWDLRVLTNQGADTTAVQAEIQRLRDQLQALNEQAGLCIGAGPYAFGLDGAAGMGGRFGAPRGYGYGAGPRAGWRGYGGGPGYGAGYGPRFGAGYRRGPGYTPDASAGLNLSTLNNMVRRAHQQLLAARDAGQDTTALEAEIRRLSALRARSLQGQ